MTNLTRASHELFRRTPDETFPSLEVFQQHFQWQREQSLEIWQPPRSPPAGLFARTGHIHPEHFRSPAADSSLCHFDDKLPCPARSRPVLKCALERHAVCISCRFQTAAPLAAHPRCQLCQGVNWSKLLRRNTPL